MRTVLRVLSLTSMAGFVLILSQRLPGVTQAISGNHPAEVALGIVGALTAFSAFGSWTLAIYHWGSRFPRQDSSRRAWGGVVIFGAFIGGWIYSFFAPVEEMR